MYKNFTRRHGLDKPEYDLKYKYLPSAFRLDIYKAAKSECDAVQEYCLYRNASISINKENVRFYTVDEMEEYYSPDLFIKLVGEVEWHEMLSLIEFFVNEDFVSSNTINELFEYHKVGYCYENLGIGTSKGQVIVHYKSVIEDAERAIEKEIPFKGVIASIKAAKKALTNPEEISQAHSIKNSVDALEGYLQAWLKEKGQRVSNLGDAIKVLKKKKLVPDHIVKSIELNYIFRHQTPNAGHGSPELAEITKEHAMLCLEMTVSFINYFHRLAE